MRKLPELGELYAYTSPMGEMTSFKVVSVDSGTGAIYLQPYDPEEAQRIVQVSFTDKHGKTSKAPALSWVEKLGQFAVNVEWDVWETMSPLDRPKARRQPELVSEWVDEMTRIGNVLGLSGEFLKEFGFQQVEEKARELRRAAARTSQN